MNVALCICFVGLATNPLSRLDGLVAISAKHTHTMLTAATAIATVKQKTTQTTTPTPIEMQQTRPVYYKTPEEVRKMIGQRILKRNGWPVKSKPAHRFASDNELNQLRL